MCSFSSLVVLPQINIDLKMDALSLKPIHHVQRDRYIFNDVINFFQKTSKRLMAVSAIILLAALYKIVSVIQTVIQRLRNKTDIYMCQKTDLVVPTGKRFPYKITKMIVDEQDSLVCSYNNGSVYVWDLYNQNCCYYINRRFVYLFIYSFILVITLIFYAR